MVFFLRTWMVGVVVILGVGAMSAPGEVAGVKVVPIGMGWAGSSINAVIFRHNSVTTFGETQYASFYDGESHVVLAKRKLGEERWEVRQTQYSGNTRDAHNTIAIAVDGAGILHMAWDHHGNKLNYVQSVGAGSLELTERLTTDGTGEERVTYPEFYNLPDGDLLLMYRIGVSGNGDLVMKRYSVKAKAWSTVQPTLISGEGKQNAYTEFCVDGQGTFHLGWVWRGSPDVRSNHDICYARSTDGGRTWTTSGGKALALPITAGTGEIAVKVAAGSSLINQTTMAADDAGHPYIATYYQAGDSPAPQYRVVYFDGSGWKVARVGEQKTAFVLGGMGTQRVPLSRPLILVGKGERPRVSVVFRDAERGDRVSVATTEDIGGGAWAVTDLTSESYDAWEPTCDATLWKREGKLDLLVQKVSQVSGGDNKGGKGAGATMVSVLEWGR